MYPKKIVHKAVGALDHGTDVLNKYAGTRCFAEGNDRLNKTSTKWGRVTCKECIATKVKQYGKGL